jgi:predicted GIY-YIG superfamily endonuclease
MAGPVGSVSRVESVYIVRCADGSLYVGRACDVHRRVEEHNAGAGAVYTTLRRPVELVYSEECSSVTAALSRERQLKRWTKAKKEALVLGRLEAIHDLSRRRQR